LSVIPRGFGLGLALKKRTRLMFLSILAQLLDKFLQNQFYLQYKANV